MSCDVNFDELEDIVAGLEPGCLERGERRLPLTGGPRR